MAHYFLPVFPAHLWKHKRLFGVDHSPKAMRIFTFATMSGILAGHTHAGTVFEFYTSKSDRRQAALTLDRYSDDLQVTDIVPLPVHRENPDHQCISHRETARGAKWYTDTGKPASKDYCLYLFFDSRFCEGHVTSIRRIPSSNSKWRGPKCRVSSADTSLRQRFRSVRHWNGLVSHMVGEWRFCSMLCTKCTRLDDDDRYG